MPKYFSVNPLPKPKGFKKYLSKFVKAYKNLNFSGSIADINMEQNTDTAQNYAGAFAGL